MDLVKCLASALSEHKVMPDHVIFTTYQEREGGTTRIGENQKQPYLGAELTIAISDKTLAVPETPFPDICSMYSSFWKEQDSNAAVSIEPTIEGAVKLADRIGAQHGGEAYIWLEERFNILRP